MVLLLCTRASAVPRSGHLHRSDPAILLSTGCGGGQHLQGVSRREQHVVHGMFDCGNERFRSKSATPSGTASWTVAGNSLTVSGRDAKRQLPTSLLDAVTRILEGLGPSAAKNRRPATQAAVLRSSCGGRHRLSNALLGSPLSGCGFTWIHQVVQPT